MQSLLSRASRSPLALALAVLAACADEPTATRPLASKPVRQQLGTGTIITVTNASPSANVEGSLAWAFSQITGESHIKFDPSLAGATIAPDRALKTIKFVTIEGPADKGITISGGGRWSVLTLQSGGTLRNLTLRDGLEARGSGVNATGPLRLEHTTVVDNYGNGAVRGDDITLVNSTVTRNVGVNDASGILYRGKLTLINSTVAFNTNAPGMSVEVLSGFVPSVLLRNSIISNNIPFFNCRDAVNFRYEGMNLSDDTSCGNSGAIVVANPLLLPLADNGGPTNTHAFDRRSPALDAGVACDVAVDQRYVPRDAYCDVGAFEFTDFTVVTITFRQNVNVDRATGAAVLTGTVTCSRNETERVGMRLSLEQNQRGTPVRAMGFAATDCSTTPQSWSATLMPTSGAFTSGTATAAAAMSDTPGWYRGGAASSAVKLVWSRR